MKRIRAFVAANLPVETINKVADLQAELRASAKSAQMKVAWVPAVNMHITLKFLNEIPEENIWILRDLLSERLSGRPTFPVDVRGLGAFPSPSNPRILWVGVQSLGEELQKLAADVEGWLEELGFEKETRPFHPHLTLGRVKEGTTDLIGEREGVDIDHCMIHDVGLYQSVLTSKGARYTPLVTLPLVSGV